MTVLLVAFGGCALAALVAVVRIARAPDRATRVVAAELLTVCVVALVAVGGTLGGSSAVPELVLVASMVAFLAAVSFARALTGGAR